MRVSVRRGNLIVRPLVGLSVQVNNSFRDVLNHALHFPDRRKMAEEDIMRVLDSPVDVTLNNRDGDEFSVLDSTSVCDALAFGLFRDIIFDVAMPQVLAPPLMLAPQADLLV